MSAPQEPPSPEEMALELRPIDEIGGISRTSHMYREGAAAGVRAERARAGARERELEAEVSRLEDRLDVANEQIGSDRRIASEEEKRLTVEVARLARCNANLRQTCEDRGKAMDRAEAEEGRLRAAAKEAREHLERWANSPDDLRGNISRALAALPKDTE